MTETAELRRYSDLAATPWANGAGTTRVIASGPVSAGPISAGRVSANAGSAEWMWRLSIATVDGPVAFSTFAGIDRRLMNIGPTPLQIEIEGSSSVVAFQAVISFPGEAAAAALGGSSHDLNVMTRRGASRSRLDRISVLGEARFGGGSGTITAVVALGDGLTYCGGGAGGGAEPTLHALRQWDCVIGHPGSEVAVSGTGPAALVRITIL